MKSYRVNDLLWTWSGDIVVGDNGDLSDTKAESVRSFYQEVQTRVRSDLKDWQLHPQLGADLSSLMGEPNDKTTAEEGKTRIINALIKDGFCDRNRIKVRYMPVSRHHIYYDIGITLPDLRYDEELKMSILFSSMEQTVQIL